jgi:ADP-ribosylglycohydrolase
MWVFVQIGDPARVASDGDGCGAAMRTAPVGVIYPSSRLEDLTQGAYECAAPAHDGQLAICAAAAVAAAVSAALEGRPSVEVLSAALKAAKQAEAFRPSEQASTLARAIETIYSNLTRRKNLVVDEVARQYFPDKTLTPWLSVWLITESAEETVLFGANLGGDSDSVASNGGVSPVPFTRRRSTTNGLR